jgi:hypothetical protein
MEKKQKTNFWQVVKRFFELFLFDKKVTLRAFAPAILN